MSVETARRRGDHITPSGQVFALADYPLTHAEDTERRLASQDHLGLFARHEALREY